MLLTNESKNYWMYNMKFWVKDCWDTVMCMDKNPLKNINDLATRHMIMQILAWMWCIVFGIIAGSWAAFGISAILHMLLLAAIVVTVATFETAKRKPEYFTTLGRGRGGEHD